MTIYSKGFKAKAIYTQGKQVSKIYSNGKLVYQNYPRLIGSMRIDVTSNNVNSISGYIIFDKYLDWDKESSSEIIRYETKTKEFSSTDVGVVNLTFPSEAKLYIADLAVNTYNNEATLSCFEIQYLKRITTSSITWSDSISATSDYIDSVYGLRLSGILDNVVVTSGYCIAGNNRDARISKLSESNYSLASLGVTSFGNYPIYAVSSEDSIESNINLITCSSDIQSSQLFRHIGWVNNTESGISVVSLGIDINSGSNFSKSATKPNIVVSGGWGIDTDGMKVMVSSSSTDCSSYITEATKENLTLKASNYSKSSGNSSYPVSVSSIQTSVSGINITGPHLYRVKTTYSNNLASFPSHWSNYVGWWETTTQTGEEKTTNWLGEVQKNETLVAVRVSRGGEYYSMPQNNNAYLQINCNVYSVTLGPAQSVKLYHKITRQKDSPQSNTETIFMTTDSPTPDSTPYVSYVLIGTVLADTDGTLSIS